MAMTMLQMEPVRPEVWDIQRDPRPLQEEQSCLQTRKTQHLQKTRRERRATQAMHYYKSYSLFLNQIFLDFFL